MLFLRFFVLFFVLTGFSFTAKAMKVEDGNQEEISDLNKNVNSGLKLIVDAFAKGDPKHFLLHYRSRYNQNFFHLIKGCEFDKLASIIDDDQVVGDLLLEKDSNGNFAIDAFISDTEELSPRLILVLTTSRSDKGDTLLMTLAMRDENFEKKSEILKKHGIDVWQKDVYGERCPWFFFYI